MRWIMLLLPTVAQAESVVTTRALPADAVITSPDVTLVAAEIPGAAKSTGEVIGKQVRRFIAAGRPLREADLEIPVVVRRNAKVVIGFDTAGLAISAEGRALEEGAVGDVIRVMSLSSRSIISARVMADGSLRVEGLR